MKLPTPDRYTEAAISLIAACILFITIALLFPLGDITKAAFVISGMVCAMMGIFTLAFARGEPEDPWLVGILPAQGALNFCRITKHFGIEGNAYFLPAHITGESRVRQFNPPLNYDGKPVPAQGSIEEPGPPGIVTFPSGDLLIQDLWRRNTLVIPHDKDELSLLLGEIIEDVFPFAPQVSVLWEGSGVTITFHGYPYIDGCKVIAKKSSGCCAMSPCPACSICGALIAEGRDRVVRLDRCSANSSSGDVTAVFSIVPLPHTVIQRLRSR